MMMTMMMANALIMTMLMMSIEHQQLLPGEIINNQSPISQAFKSIKHIMDTRARQWSDLGLIKVLQSLQYRGIEHQNIFPVIWLKTLWFLNKVCAPWFMNSDRHSIVKMLVLTIWQDKINHLLTAWSCAFLSHWIEHWAFQAGTFWGVLNVSPWTSGARIRGIAHFFWQRDKQPRSYYIWKCSFIWRTDKQTSFNDIWKWRFLLLKGYPKYCGASP